MCSSCDVLVFARVQFFDHLVPQHAGLHDVALVHRGDFVAPLARQLEADARDALDLVGVVDLGIDGALLAVAEIGDGLRLAEIDAAGEFAHDDDVEALDRFALEARGIGERRIDDGGADIGEQAELLAQPQQPRFRPRFVRHLVPFRPADGAENHRVRRVRLRHGRVGDRHLMRVIASAADQPFLGLEIGDARFGVEAEQPFHLGHDFRADAVAGEKEEIEGAHEGRLTDIVMAGLVPAIHVFLSQVISRRGCPAQVYTRAGQRPDPGGQA